jgi:hypothetical protein
MAYFDHPLKNLKRMSVRAHRVFEKTNVVSNHNCILKLSTRQPLLKQQGRDWGDLEALQKAAA